jgi:hypothetical protein
VKRKIRGRSTAMIARRSKMGTARTDNMLNFIEKTRRQTTGSDFDSFYLYIQLFLDKPAKIR